MLCCVTCEFPKELNFPDQAFPIPVYMTLSVPLVGMICLNNSLPVLICQGGLRIGQQYGEQEETGEIPLVTV